MDFRTGSRYSKLCTAVDAGVKAVENMGAEVYSSVVIPRPHQDLGKIVTRYSLTNLLPQEE